MKYLSLLLALTFLFFACGSGSRQTSEQKLEGEKWDAVIANHDIVMPMMGDTRSIRKKLKAFVKNHTNVKPSLVQQANQLVIDLEKADESMMDWMHGFKKLGELQGTMDHTEIMAYLSAEDQKMTKVKELFNSSIEKGKAFLERNK